jgi:hypothetical protein
MVMAESGILIGDPADLKSAPLRDEQVKFTAASRFQGFEQQKQQQNQQQRPARQLPKLGRNDGDLERTR